MVGESDSTENSQQDGVEQLLPRWRSGATSEPVVVNQFAALWDGSQESLYLVAGQIEPPVIMTSDDGRELLEELGGRIPVTPKVALYMSRARAEELRDLLIRHLGGMDS